MQRSFDWQTHLRSEPTMHKHYLTGDRVQAPSAVVRAMNLIEDFIGLRLTDGKAVPASDMTAGVGAGADLFECQLLSPTGRALNELYLHVRPSDGWVTVRGDQGFRWADALQVAIDNFINRPSGDGRVLGDWKPSPEKLDVERADPPESFAP
jgi:hypothetical protein